MLRPAGELVTAGDVLTLEELALFRRVSGPRGGLLVLHAWATIVGTAALYAAWPSLLTLALVVVVIGRRRLALALLADLCGLTAMRRVATWPGWRRGLRPTWLRLRAPLLTNAVLAVACVAAGAWSLYLLVWVLPWATWYQLATRVREIAEHGLVPDAQDPLRHARTIRARWLARAVLAPYRVNYHLEHHLMVFVPCWRLPLVHRLLLARHLGDRMERGGGYAEVIARAGG